jgi:outer membrane protein assembly factor BamD
LVLFSVFLAGCGGRQTATIPAGGVNEPDRVLFVSAMNDLERSRFTIARLTLQTLINTYSDSEFLPQAKYALAQSFYREGTVAALSQAEAEFKDYITFFPLSDLADDAQMNVAMTHVLKMEKPDRDPTQAQMAELELKNMIESYPDSQLLADAKVKLREVQEVLAEGIFGIGNQYFLRRSYPAAVKRYKEILEKFPDSRRVPESLFRLAESLYRNNNEGESAIYYARLVSDYPMTERVEESKRRLVAMNMPVPSPNPIAVAQAQMQSRPENKGIFSKVFSVFSRRPDVSTETPAASVSNPESAEEEAEEENEDRGTFTIDPRVVQPATPPATRP